jgi:spermidine synthase
VAELGVVDRVETPRGELVLRRDGDAYEVISNGTFLMDTRNGQSERILVTAALARTSGPVDLLIGGLGVGFSLIEALRSDRVVHVTVVEIEPVLVGWHRTHLAPFSAGAIDDPRVSIITDDLLAYVRGNDHEYDAICLDIDNGPEWTVTEGNAALYGDDGTELLVSRLRPTGVLTVWAAARSLTYQAVLADHFTSVVTLDVVVPRGEPDVVLAGTGPHRVPR